MKEINSYLLEKLVFKKGMTGDYSNEAYLEEALKDIKNFLNNDAHIDEEDYEFKVDKQGDIRVYLYDLYGEDIKVIEDLFYKKGYAKKEWYVEFKITGYGFKIRVNKVIKDSDFDLNKKVFRKSHL